jgi:hypothetical protein
MKTKVVIIAVLVSAVAIIGILTTCQGPGGNSSGQPLDQDTFVKLYVELELVAEQSGIGTEEYDTRRDSVLAIYNTTFEDVTAMLQSYDEDPEKWAVVWEEILAALEKRKDATMEADTIQAN